MSNLRTTRNSTPNNPSASPVRGQAIKRGAVKKVTPKKVKLMTLLVSITACIFVIPLSIQASYNSGTITGIPTLRIALTDIGVYVALSLLVQFIYHMLGSNRDQKLLIQLDISKVFFIVALVIYGIFRGILKLYGV
jgi:hypothetical protein